MPEFSILPERASTIASQIDWLLYALTGLSLLFAIPVVALIIIFAIRYRRGQKVDRSNIIYESNKIEFTWAFIPLVLMMVIFVWSSIVYYNYATAPKDTLEIYVIGKQWMWKAQHPSGKGEINALHVPVNQPVKLIMTSQDVIHDMFIPAFRVKQDVLPGRYTTLWFEATEIGEYHMFCAEFCGTEHSKMTGTVTVMEELEYQQWLSGNEGGQSMAEAGQQLFDQRGCASCHAGDGSGVGPTLNGVFGETAVLEDGRSVAIDEAYLRESIVEPQAKVVAGYGRIMPTYEGIISEEGILQLVAYIKTLEAE